MSEMNPVTPEELVEEINFTIDDAPVITVPIDDTLSIEGEAADAKAVGDALALKADKSEIQTALKVDGQSADNTGNILVTAQHVPVSALDQTTVAEKLDEIAGMTGEEILMSDDEGSQTIAEAVEAVSGRTGENIPLNSSDPGTIAGAIDLMQQQLDNVEAAAGDTMPMQTGGTETVKDVTDAIAADLSDFEASAGADITALKAKTGADIPFSASSSQSIANRVMVLEGEAVRSVNETMPDGNGNVEIQSVPYADNLTAEDNAVVNGSFNTRTSGGSASVSSGDSTLVLLRGNRVHTGYVPEVLNMTVTAVPRTAPSQITAEISSATFLSAVGSTAGTYTFGHNGTTWMYNASAVDMDDYGITVSNQPVNGDQIVVTVENDGGTLTVSMVVNAVVRPVPPAITATINRETFVAYVEDSGTITLYYTTAWTADPALYGITVTNEPLSGDMIQVVYVKEERGTITHAALDRLVGTGWNLYNEDTGMIKAPRYSETWGYMIGGDWSAVEWAATEDGDTVTIEPDSSGLFNIPADGYIIVSGGGEDTWLIATWSDWTSGYSGDFEPYSESAISFSGVTQYLPYGLARVADTRDEVDLNQMEVRRWVDRMNYTPENLATVIASGVDYEYDTNYIYTARTSPVVNSISIESQYTVNEHGLELFDGTEIEIYTEILYGQNLKDKLRRDVLTISQQALTSSQKTQVQENIGAVGTDKIINNLNTTAAGYVLDARQGNALNVKVNQNRNSIAYIENTSIASRTYSKGQFIFWMGQLCTANQAIPSGNSLSLSVLDFVSEGGLNSLGNKIANIGGIYYGDKNSGSVSVSNSTTTVVSTISLPAGVHLLVACIDWEANGNGYRQIATKSNSNPARNEAVTTLPMSATNKQTYQQLIEIISLNSASSIDVYGYQTSGSALSAYPYVYAVRIK